MFRVAAVVACLFFGCASVEDANFGGDQHDLAVAAADLDGADDLARPADGGSVAACPVAQHVVVNEVKVGSATSANDEFIEIYNPCGMAVDLTGFTLNYLAAAGVSEVLVATLTKTIDANGYLLIAGPNYSNGGVPDQTYGTGRLAGAGGGLGIRDVAKALVDSVGYGTATNAFIEGAAAPAPANGQSIARIPNGADSGHNDVDFAIATTPTPRATN